METDRHYFLVGSFVLATIIGILLFAVWITSMGEGNYQKYRIRFAESVSGLSEGGDVKYRGVKVGKVEIIRIDPKDPSFIRVQIQVLEGTPIKADTVAGLKYAGITGVVFIELTGGSKDAPLLVETVEEGKIPIIRAESSTLTMIMDKLPEVFDKISHVAEQVDKLVSDENVAAFSGILGNLSEMTNNSKGDVTEAINNLNATSHQLNLLMRDLRKTSRHIGNISEELDDDPSQLIFPSEEKGVPAP